MAAGGDLLIVMAKLPEPGRVKTRLGARIGMDRACALYEAFLLDTVERLAAGRPWDTAIHFEPPEGRSYFDRFSNARTSGRVPIRIIPQEGGTLGERLAGSFRSEFERGAARVVAIGADAPSLPDRTLIGAFSALRSGRAVLGPSADGGYYLVGLSGGPLEAIFRGIDWGGPCVLDQTLAAFAGVGVKPALQEPWHDVDELEDLQALGRELRNWSPEWGGKPARTTEALEKLFPGETWNGGRG